MPQALKNSSSKNSSGQGEKLEKILAWDLTVSESEMINDARTKGAKVHFASLMDMSFEKC